MALHQLQRVAGGLTGLSQFGDPRMVGPWLHWETPRALKTAVHALRASTLPVTNQSLPSVAGACLTCVLDVFFLVAVTLGPVKSQAHTPKRRKRHHTFNQHFLLLPSISLKKPSYNFATQEETHNGALNPESLTPKP